MAQFDLALPKFAAGDLDDEKQRRRIMNYLVKLDEQLRFVLNNLDAENFTENFQQIIISSGGGSGGADSESLKMLQDELNRLSTRITQTANEIAMKASAEELNELGDLVKSLSAEFKVLADEISSKVSKEEYDSLKGTVNSHSTQIQQTAESIRLKADKTTVDTLSGKVSEHSAQFEVTAEQISSTVKRVDTLDGKVEEQSTRITQTAEAIQSKAEKSVVDDLKGTVEKQSTTITQTAAKVETKADKTTVDALGNTVAAHAAELVVQADQIAMRVTEDRLNEAVDGIQVGGTNLLKDSAKGASTTDYLVGMYYYGSRKPDAGDIVTVRVWGQLGKDRGKFFIHNSSAYMWIGDLTDNGDGTYSGTFAWRLENENYPEYNVTQESQTHLRVYAYPSNGTTISTIDKIKLEFGNKATDWSPAPEDMELEIQMLEAELLVQAGEISANAQKIETVKGTADKAATDLTAVTKRVTTAEQSISALDGQIKSKVSQTDFNALGSRVSSAESTITQQAGKITANATAIQTAQSTANAAQTQANANKNNLAGVTTRVTTAEQNISALDGKISTKVEKTEFNALGDEVSRQGTLIEQTAEDILLQAGRTVGGANYLRDSAEGLTGSAYFMGEYYFSNGLKPKAGENVTIRIWGSLGSDRTAFGIWNTNGYIPIGSLTNNGDGTFSGTFEWKVDSANYPEYSVTEDTQKGIQIFVLPNTVTGVTSTITKIKLERGDYATDWTPHPDDPASAVDTGGVVRIDQTGVHMTGGTIEMETSDGDEFIRIRSDGIAASSLSAPNVTPRYSGPNVLYVNPAATSAQIAAGNYFRSLADALAKLNGKTIAHDVTINLAAGMTEYGTVTLQGVLGGGWVLITGNSSSRAKLVGRLNIYHNGAPVRMRYLNVDSAVNAHGISIANGYSEILYCTITGKGTGDAVGGAGNTASAGIFAQMGGRVQVSNCELYDVYRALYTQTLAEMQSINNKGNCIVGANRTHMFVSGTAPSDSASQFNYSEVMGGKVWPGSVTVDQGSKPTPEAEPVTVTYNYLYSDSYAGKWGRPSTDVAQGFIRTDDSGNTAAVYGTIWFDAAAMRSALSSKSIKQASLRLSMLNYGRGEAVSVQLYGTNTAYSGRSGQPQLTTNYGTIGTTEPGETAEITIPTAVISDIVSGHIQALVLKSDDEELHKNRDYSRNYARFAGSATATADTRPRLTVVYK